jgi:O-antigen ligase
MIGIWIMLLSRTWKWRSAFLLALVILVSILFVPEKFKLIMTSAKADWEIRKTYIEIGIGIVQQHPIFGIGMNHVRQLPSIGYGYAHLHNHFLHTAAELGIPGFIGLASLLIGALSMCHRIWKRSKTPWMRTASRGLAAGQLAHMFFGLVDSVPLGAKVGIFFWFSLALITAMHNVMMRNECPS